MRTAPSQARCGRAPLRNRCTRAPSCAETRALQPAARTREREAVPSAFPELKLSKARQVIDSELAKSWKKGSRAQPGTGLALSRRFSFRLACLSLRVEAL